MSTYRGLLAAFTLVWQIGYVRIVWRNLPAMLPDHFALDGTPDRFAPKTILLFLIAIELAVVVLLTLLQRYPRTFNLPSRPGEPDRTREEGLALRMLSWMRLEITLFFAYFLWSIVNTAQRRTNGLGSAFIFLAVAISVATSIYYLRQIKKA